VSDARERAFAKKELGELLEQLYLLAPRAQWVSRPQAIRNAGHKYPQLGKAKEFGFEVPRTAMTNSLELARSFIASCAQGAVYKTLYRPAMMLDYDADEDDPGTLIIPTTRLTEKDYLRLNSLPLTGGIFQEYIEKEYELRVTVMGSTVFAARIDSQTNPDEVGRTDWRMGQNIAMSYSLPDAVAEKCRTIVKEYGLAFGAIDLIKTPDGRYVFLELNPNGQWAWLEELTGDPYIETFVKLLSK
jgi:glutathione synthase/RimK-type ligase-like ATP-grasp enzyme